MEWKVPRYDLLKNLHIKLECSVTGAHDRVTTTAVLELRTGKLNTKHPKIPNGLIWFAGAVVSVRCEVSVLTRCKNPPDDSHRLSERETRLESRITVLELIIFRYVRISGIDNKRRALRNLRPTTMKMHEKHNNLYIFITKKALIDLFN